MLYGQVGANCGPWLPCGKQILEDLCQDHAGFVARVQATAQAMVQERLLLPDDALRLVEEARRSRVLAGS